MPFVAGLNLSSSRRVALWASLSRGGLEVVGGETVWVNATLAKTEEVRQIHYMYYFMILYTTPEFILLHTTSEYIILFRNTSYYFIILRSREIGLGGDAKLC